MRKYTQRELHNEAFRNILKGAFRVAGKGILGAAKNVAKHISPELYGMAKSAKEIYNSGDPNAVLKDYITKNRSIPVYISSVSEDDIKAGTLSHILKDTFRTNAVGATVLDDVKNSNNQRLKFTNAGKEEDIGDDIIRIPFEASSKSYYAYIDKIDENKHQILGIKEK